MRSSKTLVFVICIFSASVIVQAQTNYNLRLLFHGTKAVENSNFATAGWFVAPNITKVPNKWLVIAGPRYNGVGWWVEPMTGFFFQQGQSTSLIDIRAKLPDIGPVTPWINVEKVGLRNGEAESYYAYLQLEHPLPWNIGNIGLETENIFQEGQDVISAGAHLAIPFDKATLVMVYQLHRAEDNQIWLRMVTNI